MKKNLILHLGAHKTATTYIQDTLEKNSDILIENDVFFIPRKYFRKEITEKYFYPKSIKKPINFKLNDVINELKIESNNLIISDESIVGLVREQLDNGLYNDTRQRLLKLKDFIGDDFNIKEIHYTVRPYDTYFPSAYSETLRRMDFYDFEIIKRNMQNDTFDWNIVLDEIGEVFGASSLVVLDYRKFRDVKQSYFKRLMFNKEISLDYIKRNVRSGYSKDVIDVLSMLSKEYGSEKISPQLKKSIISNFNSSDSKYHPFNELESAVLVKLYETHLKNIANKYELINCN